LYNPDHKLLEFLRSKGIVPEAYSPLGSTGSPLFSDEVAVEIASKHSVKPADVLLAWLCTSHAQFISQKTGVHPQLASQTKRDVWFSQNPSPLLVSMPT